MPPLPKRDYVVTLDEHRRRLGRLAERRGVGRIKSFYDRAQEDVARKLSRTAGKGTFTAFVHRQTLAQLRQGQVQIARHMAGELGDLSEEAQVESLRGLSSTLGRLEQKFTGTRPVLPIDEAARFAGVIDKRRSSLLRMHDVSMANYGGALVGEMEEQLGLSLLEEETTMEAIDRVMGVAENEWWQAERIVRSETAWAYNSAHADGLEEASEELPDLMMRWSEHVDDETFEPLDKRVGVDSIALHGQLAEPGGVFTMPAETPDGEPVSESLVGQSWAFPPNRPNDRAVIQPWRPGWGIPGWIYRGGERQWINE